MAVSTFDFIRVGEQYGYTEKEAVDQYEFMVKLGYDMSRMTSEDLNQLWDATSKLEIVPRKRPKKGLLSRLLGRK